MHVSTRQKLLLRTSPEEKYHYFVLHNTPSTESSRNTKNVVGYFDNEDADV